MVWDKYDPASLKSAVREERGFGDRRKVGSLVPLPGDWANFLHDDVNKEEFFAFLSTEVIQSLKGCWYDVFATFGEKCLKSNPFSQVTLLKDCNHKEADTRVMVHVKATVEDGCSEVTIRTVDTDMVCLAIHVYQDLLYLDKFWIAFCMEKTYKLVPIHEISTKLSPSQSKALPLFHALIGCDS